MNEVILEKIPAVIVGKYSYIEKWCRMGNDINTYFKETEFEIVV
jgi:hypothetical protein